MATLQKSLEKFPNLQALMRNDNAFTRFSEAMEIRSLSKSVEKRLIATDNHLLPTPSRDIFNDFYKGNAIIVADRSAKTAVAFAAYTDRLTREFKGKVGIPQDVSGMSEFYCDVVDEEHRGSGMGTALARELMLRHYKATPDITAIVTFQENVVRLAKRAADELGEDGMKVTFRAFSGEEIPMLYPFLTLANPSKYTPEEILRIDGTNPLWKIEHSILKAVNEYLSGNNSMSFSLEGINMFFLSNVEEAYRADAALTKQFVNQSTLKEALISSGYTI